MNFVPDGDATIGDALLVAMGQRRGVAAADLLCQASVRLFSADAVAISLVHDGINIATLGASDAKARSYDELQFTLGEGPCLDAVISRSPIMITDLTDLAGDARWPAYREAVLSQHIRGVCAMPITVGGQCVGALDVFHAEPPVWTVEQVVGVADAAELAQLPVMDLLNGDLHAAATEPGSDAWTELHTLTRAEISQATGMLMAQLNLTAATALARLRGLAYSTGRGATSIARDIIDHRLHMEAD